MRSTRTLVGWIGSLTGFLILIGPLLGPAAAASLPSLSAPHVSEPPVAPATGDGQVPLLVAVTPPYDDLEALVLELGGRVQHRFEHLDGLAITLPAGAEASLRERAPRIEGLRRQRLLHRAVVPFALPGGERIRDGFIQPLPVDPALFQIVTVDPGATGLDGDPGSGPATFLGYDQMIGAAQVWEVAGYGEGAIVCVIDTGVYPDHPLIAGSVVGGENLVPAEEEEEIDADGDGTPDGLSFDWDAIENDDHGTFVSGLIAGHADVLMPAEVQPALSLAYHSPESVEQVDSTMVKVRLFGTAPEASIYGIKVFPYDGGSAPDARVVAAIDRVIAMKESGELDIDVVNMSLSGGTLRDGDEFLDRIVDRASAAGITVVAAASNDGPSLMTVGTPGCAHTALAVGGAVDPLHTRVAIETFFGGEPGMGELVYPYDDAQIVGFSSRGPTADGRVKPDLVATALFNFSATLIDTDENGLPDTPSFGFASGTSFATPTVAGAAALLHAYADGLGGRYARPPFVANVLTRRAVPLADPAALAHIEQGAGFVELTGAFGLMESGHVWHGASIDDSNPNQRRLSLDRSVARGASPMLAPGQAYDFLVRVPPSATRLELSFPEVTLSEPQNPLIGDALEIWVHSAKRGGTDDYVFVASGAEPGDTFTYHYPEPGLMRVTMVGSMTNWSPVGGSCEIRAASEHIRPDVRLSGTLGAGETREHTIEVPDGTAALGVMLGWGSDWTRFPTHDLELFLDDGSTTIAVATLDSPERALIEAPAAGTWTLRVEDAATLRDEREWYRLLVAFFDELPGGGADAMLALGAPAGGVGAWLGGDGPLAATVTSPPRAVTTHPNPANPATDIRFELDDATSRARVAVYDVGGRLVARLVDGPAAAGVNVVRWDGRTARGALAASGVYFVMVETPGGSATHKLVLGK